MRYHPGYSPSFCLIPPPLFHPPARHSRVAVHLLVCRHRADADYYPRLYSMLLDQIEIVAADGAGPAEMFRVEYGTQRDLVPLERAKEFIIARWGKFIADGKDRRFKVVPAQY